MIIDELVALLGYKVDGEEDLKHFNKGLENATKKAEALGKAIGVAAGVAIGAAATGFAFLGKSVLDTSAKFESYQATLETIEGSSEKAEKALSWISDFAKTTPYEVAELTEAFVKLRAYGMDPMDGTLVSLGDTAAGMGKNLMQAVEALADAATGEFERIKEFGVKASVEGEKVTFKWMENNKEMSKTVKKSGAEITKTLQEIWGKRFAGAMIRQSKTWNGMMSNLGDSWVAFQRKIGDAGFFDTVKNKLAGVMDLLSEWENDETTAAISEYLSYAFTKTADAIGLAFNRIVTHFNFFMDNGDKFAGWLKAIGAGFLLLAARLFPVITLLSLAVFAIDDFLTYLEGGDSAIGSFIESVKKLLAGDLSQAGEVFKTLALGVGALAGAGFVLAGFTAALWPLVTALTAFSGAYLLAKEAFAYLEKLDAKAAATKAVENPRNKPGYIESGGYDKDGKFIYMNGDNRVDRPVENPQAGFSDDLLDYKLQLEREETQRTEPVLNEPAQSGFDPSALDYKLELQNAEALSEPVIGLQGAIKNLEGNLAKLGGTQNGELVTQDNSTLNNNQTNNINTTINQTVQQATQAPAAAANATAGAVNRAAQPPRMNAGMN